MLLWCPRFANITVGLQLGHPVQVYLDGLLARQLVLAWWPGNLNTSHAGLADWATLACSFIVDPGQGACSP